MPHINGYYYEFGPYKFDQHNRVLTREGEVVPLAPRAIDILLVLVKNAGQLIEKDELMKELWPDTFVEESNLAQNIFLLRRALGDHRSAPTYIETVTRRGYRFISSVTKVSYASPTAKEQASEAQESHIAKATGIAVLPFANDTGDPSIDYLADGITETIINKLSRISKLRVMSRSSVFRYRGRDLNPAEMGQALGIDAVLIGKIYAKPSGLVINAELVDTSSGWQLWGENFDCELSDILKIQDEIALQLSSALRLKLTGEEAKKLTTRYTENSQAYQSYLEGRYYWSRYTKAGIERAIGHFRKAIELDPNYALAYSGIVDCYLRLATNYLPPKGDQRRKATNEEKPPVLSLPDLDLEERVRRRCEWDWAGAERELRRGIDLQAGQTWAHQWDAAYRWTVDLKNSIDQGSDGKSEVQHSKSFSPRLGLSVTPSEEIQILCAIARDQIQSGNYDAGALILQRWWRLGNWPRLDQLSMGSGADLMFTVGAVAGNLASTGRIRQGQKHAQALLNGSIAFFEHLGARARAAEGRIELARSYYREGLFDLARQTLSSALGSLPDDQNELRGVCLLLQASIERDAGRFRDSFIRLKEVMSTMDPLSPLLRGRYHHELATTLKEIGNSSYCDTYYDDAMAHFKRALEEFEATGNHRHAAASENNLGFLLLDLKLFDESEFHLLRAKQFFEGAADLVRCAQVNDSLAKLYVGTQRLELAEKVSSEAVHILSETDEEALLAEALTTRGLVACKLSRYSEAKSSFDGANRVANLCGDREGAGRALLVMCEEMMEQLEEGERTQATKELGLLLGATQQASIATRLRRALALMSSN